MKQLFQDLSNGNTYIDEIPSPSIKNGNCLIETRCSLISIGTEKMLIDFGKSNWLQRAQQQPDKVKMVLEKLSSDGVISTLESVKSKLNEPIALGYCNVGKIIDPGNTKFKKGDRVISNGNHAEIVRVPENLISKIPDNVDNFSASFTVMSSIALQGIRLVKPEIGENIAVIGLGLIGLLTVQILKANGCNVVAIDLDTEKCNLAKEFGADVIDLSQNKDQVQEALTFSSGHGLDAVLITASSKNNDIISNAAKMCRKRARIVLVGVVGLNINRDDFYEKELNFQVSCSYGPGRYDHDYEENGIDYPYDYVRWTENRNFEAVLDLMASKKINTETNYKN